MKREEREDKVKKKNAQGTRCSLTHHLAMVPDASIDEKGQWFLDIRRTQKVENTRTNAEYMLSWTASDHQRIQEMQVEIERSCHAISSIPDLLPVVNMAVKSSRS